MFGAYTPLAATRLDAPLFIPIQRPWACLWFWQRREKTRGTSEARKERSLPLSIEWARLATWLAELRCT